MSTVRIFEMIVRNPKVDKKSLIKFASDSASLMNTVTSIINNSCANLTLTKNTCPNSTAIVSDSFACPYEKASNITASFCGNESTLDEIECIKQGFNNYDTSRDYGCVYNWLPYILSISSGLISLTVLGVVIMLKNRESGNILCKDDNREVDEGTTLMSTRPSMN